MRTSCCSLHVELGKLHEKDSLFRAVALACKLPKLLTDLALSLALQCMMMSGHNG